MNCSPASRGDSPLPSEEANRLSRPGYDEEWLARQPAGITLTVRCLHAKMADLDLWRFVAREDGTERGTLRFLCSDVDGLWRATAALGFTAPAREASGRWERAERRARAALHFKHFAGYPEQRVQAHIDPWGGHLSHWWWLLPPLPLLQMARHGLDARGYEAVDRIADLLRRQGVLASAAIGTSSGRT